MSGWEKYKEIEERRKKAIPSKVFFNHFFAVHYHILSSNDRYELKRIPFYNTLKLRKNNFNIDIIENYCGIHGVLNMLTL